MKKCCSFSFSKTVLRWVHSCLLVYYTFYQFIHDSPLSILLGLVSSSREHWAHHILEAEQTRDRNSLSTDSSQHVHEASTLGGVKDTGTREGIDTRSTVCNVWENVVSNMWSWVSVLVLYLWIFKCKYLGKKWKKFRFMRKFCILYWIYSTSG